MLGAVCVNGGISATCADLQHLSNVKKTEQRRRQMRDEIIEIAHCGKVFPTLTNALRANAPNYARTSKTISKDVFV